MDSVQIGHVLWIGRYEREHKSLLHNHATGTAGEDKSFPLGHAWSAYQASCDDAVPLMKHRFRIERHQLWRWRITIRSSTHPEDNVFLETLFWHTPNQCV